MKYWISLLAVLMFFGTSNANDDELIIGVVLPLSGEKANYGVEALNGINLAVENFNQSGGIKNKILKVAVRDNAGDPVATSNEIASLISDDKVMAVIGPITSTNSAAAAAIAQQSKIPLILPVATSPYVTEIGNYIVRICFTDPFQSKALAQFAYKNLKSERAAIIYEKGSSYSEVLAEFFAKRFESMGGIVTQMKGFESVTGELPELLDQTLEGRPDLIFAPVYYQEGAIILKRLNEVQSQVTILGGDGWESPELFRLAGDNIKMKQLYISSHFSPQLQSNGATKFIENFIRTYGYEPNGVSALGFDAIGVLADAVKRATIISRDGLREALVTTVEFPGVTGRITLNEKRNAVKDIYILEAQKGEFIYEGVISSY